MRFFRSSRRQEGGRREAPPFEERTLMLCGRRDMFREDQEHLGRADEAFLADKVCHHCGAALMMAPSGQSHYEQVEAETGFPPVLVCSICSITQGYLQEIIGGKTEAAPLSDDQVMELASHPERDEIFELAKRLGVMPEARKEQ